MEPYKAKQMPLEYKIDKEMLRLIAEANVRYEGKLEGIFAIMKGICYNLRE